MPKEKNEAQKDDKTITPSAGDAPPADNTSADDPQDTPEGGTTPRRTLQYSKPEELADGKVRVRASDGQGNSLTVTADDKSKAQASLRAGFKALHGDD